MTISHDLCMRTRRSRAAVGEKAATSGGARGRAATVDGEPQIGEPAEGHAAGERGVGPP